MQGRNRDADIEKRLVDTVGEGEGGMNWECSIKTYILPGVKQRASVKLHNTGSSNQHTDKLEERDGGGRGQSQEGGDVCVFMDESCYCTTETNTVKQLSSN